MAETESEDRTEQATPRRRQKAREEGRIARSRELVGMASLGGILSVFYLAGTSFMRNLAGLTGRLLGLRYGRDSLAVIRSASLEMMWILAPFFAAAVAAALLSSLAQGGFLVKPLSFDLERINPLKGFKNLFSITALPGFLKSLLKFVLGVTIFYLVMKKVLLALPVASALEIGDIQRLAGALVGKAVLYMFGTFFVLAGADYAYEWWKLERSLRMTKDEIREEFRESEGDPLIKAKIKALQKDMARRRMMEAVPKATVVITNPTHIAVALSYRKEESEAPRVVAKGKGFVAQKIKEIARSHRIPLVEDKPLARALVKLKLDAAIPAELYRAVAKILAYIYKLRGAAA
ncbi:MAG TPA: EscU/YscU/HrcU family type III secretion system export apparatus switch protein [Nitrospirota bacterium]|nr:EscU/YscU/HrcU family type III secretion system export apparatus switch protein [Nitrospirota bacterium]